MPLFDSFFAELKRRRVLPVLGLYLIGGWVAIQVAATIFPVFGFPDWATRLVVIAVAVGLPAAFILAWSFDVGASGIRRTAGAVPRPVRLLAALVAGALVLGAGATGAVEITQLLRRTAPPRPGRVVHVTTAPGLELDPALSPDGRTIAYAAGAPGEMRIREQELDGGRVIEVADALAEHQRSPAWSPDGGRLLFQAGGRELSTGDADTLAGAKSALYAVPALGGTPRRLTPAGEISGAWSPDGRRVAFIEARGIYGVAIRVAAADDPNGGRRVATVADAHALRWSPDGAMLAFVTGNPRFDLGTAHLGNDAPSELWTLTLADGHTHRLTSGESLDVSPVWMPDGRSLLFVSGRDGTRDVYRIRVNRQGEPADSAERITSGLNAHGIDLSRDGRLLAYSSFTSYSHIWALPVPRSGVASLADARQMTFGNETIEGIALSPDGRWLAYDSNRSGNGDIWKVSAEGGAPEQLTTNPAGEYVQDFSPDGREIAYHSIREGVRHVFVMSADGSDPQQITFADLDESNPDFRPDGNTIVYEAWTATPDGIWSVSRPRRGAPWGRPRRLTASGTDPSCSPDGRWIAYIRGGALHLMLADGSGDRTLVESAEVSHAPGPDFAYWSPDSRTIYYKAFDAEYRASIWSVPVSGGPPRLLVRFDDPSRPSLRREFATDGRTLYFTVADPQSDIWVMELERE